MILNFKKSHSTIPVFHHSSSPFHCLYTPLTEPFVRNNVSSACDMNLKINFVTTVSCFRPYCSHISATIHIIHKSSCHSLTIDALQLLYIIVSKFSSSSLV